MNKQTKIFNELAEQVKKIESQKRNIDKQEYERKLTKTIHLYYKEYKKAEKKSAYKKCHDKRKLNNDKI